MPTYTFNVPQANQQIAATQGPILENFTYLQTSIGTEHNFDVTDPAKTYHLQASMPNRALDPAALPAGTNGMYYIKGGVPKYYDATTVSFIDFWTNISTGTFSSGSGGNVTILGSIPSTVNMGLVYIWYADPGTPALSFVSFGQFVRVNTKIQTYQYQPISGPTPFSFVNLPGTADAIRGFTNNASYYTLTFNYRVYYT